MATEMLMPQLGESVTEGTIVHWLKQPGDQVALDESLAEIETEKVNVELPSPFEGRLLQQLVAEGETVDVGTPIASFEAAAGTESSTATPAAAVDAQVAAPSAPGAAKAIQSAFSANGPLGPQALGHGMFSTAESATHEAVDEGARPAVASQPIGQSDPVARNAVQEPRSEQPRYSPAVSRLAGEHRVDLRQIAGTGAGGRVTRKDVQRWIDSGPVAATPVAPSPAEPLLISPSRPAEPPGVPPLAEQMVGDGDALEPLSATRRAIARHMSESVRTIPHAWMMIEVDVSGLVALREAIAEPFKQREGVDLTYLPFMLQSLVQALRDHPRLNSGWREDGIVIHRQVNLGIAVSTPHGLLVPVLQNAGDYAIAGLARRVADLATRARERRLSLSEVQGGTCTLDNTGAIGSVASQPIINAPQCAIVTMERIVRRPVAIGDGIGVRPIMNCCISFDHRIVDGGDVGPFMQTLKRLLESYKPGLEI